MKLLLKRMARKDSYTIGKLYINDEYFCDTLEDKDRGLTQSMSLAEISKKKIYSQTAIPSGTYLVTITHSNKYKRKMPLINDVPGYAGIRIHSGNTHQDTAGCILVGKNKAVGKVLESRATYQKLFEILSNVDSNEQIQITIQ